MVDLIDEAFRLQEFLDGHQCRFCFIGGIAVQHWGEPRLTRDIDISLLAGFGSEEHYVDLLLGAYRPRMEGARQFAAAHRVLLLASPGGIGIDVSLAALSYEELMIERARKIDLLPHRSLRLCSAEDLVIMKLFAGRDTDMRDARSVLARQGKDRLDWAYLEAHLAEFDSVKEGAGLVEELRRMRDSIG